ncbi:hypothetical protein DICPUDRAFT_157949 [Dictyostelium purpureum]|uniref:Sugar phosphate transporter domain-containing protein n=1 Tax=Dictyostelium purpureum TaxID=5786 RepID=F1A0F5_DICPU|nr:uncharacterized protein DICPUDRAFT_157949 [Dictyostelium purpureum]EGC30329.1 hypothetical protein DICPUDRAFT_157949 [Dictyostelium purpureum]|eukprot:XP_003293152.1 hypothetical protein DICPUDRAFT_157949 [Dictyostelium purpureum]
MDLENNNNNNNSNDNIDSNIGNDIDNTNNNNNKYYYNTDIHNINSNSNNHSSFEQYNGIGAAILGPYPFPLTSSFFQTLGAVTILLIFNLIQYRYQKNDLVQKSYFFDKNFIQKSLIMIPVSLCFALVMILTNLAIQMVPVDYHVVIKSTNIIWVVLFSILINKEKPSIFEYFSIGLLLAGTLLVSLVFAKEGEGTAKSIIINLLSSFFESLTIVVLKWACTYLYRIDETITVIEISLFKVVQGSIAIAIPMFFIDKVNGFKVLPELPTHVLFLLISGIFITMVYQTCTVWLSKSMYSTTVGIISQLQIIPQEFINIISGSFVSSPLHIVGVVLSALGCCCFSAYHFFKIFSFKKSVQFKSVTKDIQKN